MRRLRKVRHKLDDRYGVEESPLLTCGFSMMPATVSKVDDGRERRDQVCHFLLQVECCSPKRARLKLCEQLSCQKEPFRGTLVRHVTEVEEPNILQKFHLGGPRRVDVESQKGSANQKM